MGNVGLHVSSSSVSHEEDVNIATFLQLTKFTYSKIRVFVSRTIHPYIIVR